jgi:alpha-mannosidase
MFTKTEVIKNLHHDIASYEFLWESSGDVFWKDAVDDKKHEMVLTEALADDANFLYNRATLLNQQGFYERSLERLDSVFPTKLN